jgi:hypothetical protein
VLESSKDDGQLSMGVPSVQESGPAVQEQAVTVGDHHVWQVVIKNDREGGCSSRAGVAANAACG